MADVTGHTVVDSGKGSGRREANKGKRNDSTLQQWSFEWQSDKHVTGRMGRRVIGGSHQVAVGTDIVIGTMETLEASAVNWETATEVAVVVVGDLRWWFLGTALT